MSDKQLKYLSPVFDTMYSVTGRPSIPPEKLLKACLLIALFSIRSERQLCERLEYDLMFRVFLDMGMDDAVFDASSFAKNKERLLAADVAKQFFEAVVRQAAGHGLMSREHFTVDGTLIEAWASVKSFKRRDKKKGQKPPDDPGNPTVNFHGEKRSNETHESTTDPEARMAKKGDGQPAKLSFGAHVLMENRNGLCADVTVTQAGGTAEWDGALLMLDRQQKDGLRPRTLGADAGYDVRRFVTEVRARGISTHIASTRDTRRRSWMDGRTKRHDGYAISQRVRKRVEEVFGWWKTVGGFRKTRYRGAKRTGLWAYITAAAYNLTRMARLLPA
jgi:transposase